ncbi:MAG TPA: hypothetical protein VGF06_10010 [Terriglobales bacterium]|jgi:hypothetical protein
MSAQSNPAGKWQELRLVYLLYVRMSREFSIERTMCDELETGIEVPSKEDFEAAYKWLAAMDEKIQAHQLRQFLQTTTGVNEETLLALVRYLLAKPEHSDADRDKTDFLLVQFVTQTVETPKEDSPVDDAFVGLALRPVLGEVEAAAPDWLTPLEDLATRARACGTLNGLFSSGILEKGRKIKTGCGQNYFVPSALVGFTRFNFILRRVFFHLMHQDINAILQGLRELEANGVEALDCRAAQFSQQESIAQLRMICQSWKVMFLAEYSSGQPMRMLADLRGVIDNSLVGLAARGAAAPKVMAAAAAASAGDTPEFEVSAGAPDHTTD